MKKARTAVVAALIGAIASCTPAPPEPEPAVTSQDVPVARSGGGTVGLPLHDAAAMRELQGLGVNPVPAIELLGPAPEAIVEPGRVQVSYRIDNYQVSEETGQHVHVILDDQAYAADYSPDGSVTFEAEQLSRGTHVLTVFLSRPMHVALKNPEASSRVRFHVGEPSPEPAVWDLEAPTLLYSRPKGQYSRADGAAANIMLDFYLFNAALGDGQYAVRVTVDGGAPGLVRSWEPSIVLTEPAPGEHSIRLELLDAEGNPVPGPSNDTTRTIVIVE